MSAASPRARSASTRSPADSGVIRTAAAAAGMKTLLQDGMEKAAAGVTTVREVLRVTQES